MAVVKPKAKLTKAHVEYRDYPSGTKSCRKCTMFQPPNRCSYVRGNISEHGYCRAFNLKIGKVARDGV